ncbi:hypothetical protein GT50_11000 [Geobacillus stearothermophilus 10]|nr:hypothetical protein GT50_11000 [Geobacillus stearothermophilus 10]
MPPINAANTNDMSVIYSSNMVVHSFVSKVSQVWDTFFDDVWLVHNAKPQIILFSSLSLTVGTLHWLLRYRSSTYRSRCEKCCRMTVEWKTSAKAVRNVGRMSSLMSD